MDVDASHVQSRVVVIANVLDIPLAGAVLGLPPSIVTWHFGLAGAVVEIEDDEPAHAIARAASEEIANSRTCTAAYGVQSTCRTRILLVETAL